MNSLKTYINDGKLNENKTALYNHPKELVRKYGKNMIDECIKVIREVLSDNSITYYEFTNTYIPKNLTLSQCEYLNYAVDNYLANAGYYFASNNDLSQINKNSLVPTDLVKYLKSIEI